MDLGDRRLVAAERGWLAALFRACIKIVRHGLRGCRQRYAAVATAPEVECLQVGLERADAVGRGSLLVRGNQQLIDDDTLPSAHLHHRPGKIVGRRHRRWRHFARNQGILIEVCGMFHRPDV